MIGSVAVSGIYLNIIISVTLHSLLLILCAEGEGINCIN
jgi:hypothetical protein